MTSAGTKTSLSVDGSGVSVQVEIKDPGDNVMRITHDRSGYRLERIAKETDACVALTTAVSV
jgi:hypothetical protein